MLVVLIVTLVSIVLMVFVFPLLLKLKPIEKINYLDHDEDFMINLDDKLRESFENIKLVKDEDGKFTSIVISPKEHVKYADLTIATVDILGHTKIKGYRLKFKDFRNLEIKFEKQPVEKIAIYVNRINFGVKKEHIIQTLQRYRLELFVGLEWLGAAAISATELWDILRNTVYFHPFYGMRYTIGFPITIVLSIVIAIAMYVVIRYVCYWHFAKYVYGGKFDDRN